MGYRGKGIVGGGCEDPQDARLVSFNTFCSRGNFL